MRKWLPLVLTLIAVALSLAVAPKIPGSIATHWNWLGQVDGTAPKWLGLSIIPIAMLVLITLLHVLPRLDPMRENFRKFWPEYQLIIGAIAALMLVMHAAMIANAMDWRINMIRLSTVLTGLIFVAIGNVMPRLRRNHIAGFRTAATLSSDTVWARTHRIGGAVTMATGMLIALGSFAPVPWGLPIIIGLSLIAMIGMLIYSSRMPRVGPPSAPTPR